MTVRIEENATDSVTIVLSRRNLLTLLAKLDGHPPGSACSIAAPMGYGEWEVIAEEDGPHYDHPNRMSVVGDSRPGPMHPATERALGDREILMRRVPWG
jgi:hypothetical protein